jgi:hypothetical protein
MRWREDRMERAESPWNPGTSMCDPGSVPGASVEDTLRRVNLYRWLNGLPPVTEAEDARTMVQECALMMSVNGMIDHYPPMSWQCYTGEGAAGAGSSNLAIGVASAAEGVDLFMMDFGVPSLGHRRWILNVPLGRVGVGYARASWRGASCLGILDFSGMGDRVWTSFPNPGFAPSFIASATWSFHSSAWSLADSAVRVVRADDGVELPVTVYYPTSLGGFGGNAVAWNPMGWTPASGVRYRVTISGGGITTPISYEVEFVDC